MSRYYLNSADKIHLGVKTDHEWRAQKRKELDAVIKAADVYLLGSAFTPMSAGDTPPHAMSLLNLLRHMRSKLTVKEWGR